MPGSICSETRLPIMLRSPWRGEPRNTSAPKRAMSKRDADMDIISMAQQARPKLMGQRDDLRAQFTAWSSLVKIRPSTPIASLVFNGLASIVFIIPRLRSPFNRAPRRSGRPRYVSISFGIGRYEPHAATEVLKNVYGDCKDKHTLLTSLLAEGSRPTRRWI